MKNSRKTEQVLGKLTDIQEQLRYFSNNDKYLKDEFEEIRLLICELALDKKVDHARFAKKLKDMWKTSEDTIKKD